MSTRRAAGMAAKRGLLVWIAAVVVILLGLIVFDHGPKLPRWVWDGLVNQAMDGR